MPIVMSLPDEKEVQYKGRGRSEQTIIRDPSKEKLAEAFIKMSSGRLFQVCFKRRNPKPGYPNERIMTARTGVKKYVKGVRPERKTEDKFNGLITVFEMGGKFEVGDKVAYNKTALGRVAPMHVPFCETAEGRIVALDGQYATISFGIEGMRRARLEYLKRIAYKRIPLNSVKWVKVDGQMIYFKDVQVVTEVYTTVRRRYFI